VLFFKFFYLFTMSTLHQKILPILQGINSLYMSAAKSSGDFIF